MLPAVCVLLGIGAAPVVRPFTARPRSSHYGWENGSGVQICLLVVFGAVRVLLLSAEHLSFSANEASRSSRLASPSGPIALGPEGR